MTGAQAAGGHEVGQLVVGRGHPAGRDSRQEGQASLGEEPPPTLDGCPCPLDPGKGTASQTKRGSWGMIRGTPGQQAQNSWVGGCSRIPGSLQAPSRVLREQRLQGNGAAVSSMSP